MRSVVRGAENNAAASSYAKEFVSFFGCRNNQAKVAQFRPGKLCPSIDFGPKKTLNHEGTRSITKVSGFKRFSFVVLRVLRGSGCFPNGERYFSHWLDSRLDAGHLAAGPPISNN